MLVSVDAARLVTGSFPVAASQSTAPITVVFLDDDGAPLTPDTDEYLKVDVAAPFQCHE